MKEYNYKKVDAFTSEESMGNPAAYIEVLENDLTPEQMLAFGKAHAGFVSEVVFVTPSDHADCKLTYYSSECEVDFCGHGTIATMYELIRGDKELSAKKEITIETNKKGLLTVYNEIESEGAVYITAPKAIHLQAPVDKKEAAQALGIPETEISGAYPVDFIDAGLRTLIVPIQNLATEVSAYPKQQELKEFCEQKGIDIILIYSLETALEVHKAHTRVFAPKFGYLEDPATGSGNSAFANYLLKNAMWDGTPISVEQGGDRFAYNTVKLKTLGENVLFGGQATLRINGTYLL